MFFLSISENASHFDESQWLIHYTFFLLFYSANQSFYITYSAGDFFSKPRSLFLRITSIASTDYCHPIIEFLHPHHAVRGQQDLMSITGEKGIVKKCLFYCEKIEEF